jgi:hypothetical protein
VPPGGIDQAARFYGEVVGLERIERPETLGGVGAWFRSGAQELHVSEYEGFVPAVKAHPAFALPAAELDALAARLERGRRRGPVGRPAAGAPAASTRSTRPATGSSF